MIIGGGPAGSTAALYLSRAGFKTCLIEKKKFPREVLCGEFLSGEVSYLLQDLNLFEKFLSLNPVKISGFRYVVNNSETSSDISFPAYAVKRSIFDEFLLNCALDSGTIIHQPAEVIEVRKEENKFSLNIIVNGKRNLLITADIVIAAYGKQNLLDKKLKRDFAAGANLENNKVSFNGIKFYLDRNYFRNFPEDEIRIYADENIYCGLNPVNKKEITLCFLEKRHNGDEPVRIKIKNLLQRNKKFGSLFWKSSFRNPVDISSGEKKFEEHLFELTVIGTGNIYFGKKKAVENGIFFIGDAAGMIAPLTGDGIGMAMDSARILSALIIQQKKDRYSREFLEEKYLTEWNNSFLKRIKVASFIQQAILNKFYRRLSFKLVQRFPMLISQIIKSTRSSFKHS